MRRLRAWLLRFGGFFAKSRRDEELAEELTAHLQAHINDNLRAGMTPEEARRQALLALGGLDQAKEQYRDRRSIPILETTIQDLRYALRAFRKSPTFAGAAILTLGLAIGVNTAIFSVTDALIFRPPNVPRPDELVRVFSSTKEIPFGQVSYPDYLDFRSRNTTLSGTVAYHSVGLPVSKSRDEAAQVVGAFVVSSNYFSVLGVEPTLGRGFQDDDDRVAGRSAVVVISRVLWERSFQSDPAVIGRQLIVAKRTFTIIGVAPAGFTTTELLQVHPDVFIASGMINDVVSSLPANLRDDRSTPWLTVLGRLKPGVTADAASAEMTTLARSLEQTHSGTNRQRSAIALPEVTARGKLNTGGYQGSLFVRGVVLLVLLIACANVANLMLSHGAGRTKEIAVRLAMGASRGRLVRQLLTESLLLASGGGVCGLLLAYAGTRAVSAIAESAFSTSPLRFVFDPRVDQRVLLFALGASLATVVVFSLAPSLRSTRVDLVPALKASMRTGTGRRRWLTTRGVLVASQLALSVVILTIAGNTFRQFVDLSRTDPGFRTDRVLLLTFDPGVVGYERNQTRQFFDRIVAQTQALPGVEAVGLAQSIPVANGRNFRTTSLVVDGFDMPKDQEALSILSNVVDPGYWRVMRTPIMRGRAFDARDTSTSPLVIVVNETMAERYWPNQDALGRTVRLGSRGGPPVEVIGVAKDGKYNDIGERPQQPAVFIPFSQKNNTSMAATLVVLAAGDATSLAAPIQSEVKALDTSMPVSSVDSLENVYETALSQELVPPQIMASLGALAMVLAVVGLYGVMAYLTTLRTREIGIRMALGANRRHVLMMVLRQATGMVGGGLAVGTFVLLPTYASAFNFDSSDPMVIATASLVLITAAFAASLIPARRAAMVSPMVALRDE